MSFKSANGYDIFNKSVRHQFRYARTPAQDTFLKAVVTTSSTRMLPLPARSMLWRAQLGHIWRPIEEDGVSYELRDPYPAARMKPLPDKVSDGRANSRGIACLYLATTKETAVNEVRPHLGSYVSVAQFVVLKDLRLVNCSADTYSFLTRHLKETFTQEEIERIVWSDIKEAFSGPVERGDDSLEYIPTQILAETFKANRFDGIAYKSGYGEEGYNVALFDAAMANVSGYQLYRVNNVSVDISAESNPCSIRDPYTIAVDGAAGDGR